MPRTPSSSVAFPSSSEDAPKTPFRSRIQALPTPFSKRKLAPPALSSSISTPVKPSLSTSGEEAYPTPPKEKEDPRKKDDARSAKGSGLTGQARERLASLLNKPTLAAADKKALSPAAADLVDTLRAIRARSASNASVASVATVRQAPSSKDAAYGAGLKRERTDSTTSSRSVVPPNRKRERVDSVASTHSAIYIGSNRAEKENGATTAGQNSKRQRLHSATSTPGFGPSADALAARAAARVAQNQSRERLAASDNEGEDEAEVDQMLSIEDEEWGTSTPLTPERNSARAIASRVSRPLPLRTPALAPLVRHDSTCALITPTLARSSIRTPEEEEDIPSIPSPPESPVRKDYKAPSLTEEFNRVKASHDRQAHKQFTMHVDIAHAAFWDVDLLASTPLTVHGSVRLLSSSPTVRLSTQPDVAFETVCTVAPIQRGLGRATRPQETEERVDVVITSVWTKIRGAWTAPLELRVPPSLFSGAETRALSLSIDADILLPRGAGEVFLSSDAELSVSALSTPRELALSVAERQRLEGVARERAEQAKREELEALIEARERERLLGMEMKHMTEDEKRRYREWLDAQEDVF